MACLSSCSRSLLSSSPSGRPRVSTRPQDGPAVCLASASQALQRSAGLTCGAVSTCGDSSAQSLLQLGFAGKDRVAYSSDQMPYPEQFRRVEDADGKRRQAVTQRDELTRDTPPVAVQAHSACLRALHGAQQQRVPREAVCASHCSTPLCDWCRELSIVYGVYSACRGESTPASREPCMDARQALEASMKAGKLALSNLREARPEF